MSGELDRVLRRLSQTDRPDYTDLLRFLVLVRSKTHFYQDELLIPRCLQARQLRVRMPREISKYGSILLNEHGRKMQTDELWEAHEQVAIAALQSGDIAQGERLINAVTSAFPTGTRSACLRGALLEAHGKSAEAEAFYMKVLDVNPQKQASLKKRLASLKRAQGDSAGAIQILSDYLATVNDASAWEELADIYITSGSLEKGAFCLEELLMLQPGDPGVMMTYADVLYTLGGSERWRAARAYYAACIEASGGRSVRALQGVCSSHAKLQAEKGVAMKDEEVELAKVAAQALMQRYAIECPEKVSSVKELLKSQSLI